MSLRLSQLRGCREANKKLKAKRKSNNLCVECADKVHHCKIRCDYCHLRARIKNLEKNVNRILKLFG